MNPYLSLGRISTKYAFYALRNDRKCKYNLLSPQRNPHEGYFAFCVLGCHSHIKPIAQRTASVKCFTNALNGVTSTQKAITVDIAKPCHRQMVTLWGWFHKNMSSYQCMKYRSSNFKHWYLMGRYLYWIGTLFCNHQPFNLPPSANATKRNSFIPVTLAVLVLVSSNMQG